MRVLLEVSGFDAKVTGDSKGASFAISVPSKQQSAVARVLANAGLPREKIATLPELLPRDSYMSSPAEDRARLAYGTSQELTQTLMQMAGVLHARVHVVLAEKNALGQLTSPPSASVLVRYNPDKLSPDIQETLRALVAHSVPGLAHERVTVSMFPDTVSAISGRGTSPAVASLNPASAQTSLQSPLSSSSSSASQRVSSAIGIIALAGALLAGLAFAMTKMFSRKRA